MPFDMSPLTLSLVAALAVGVLAIIVMAWRSMQASGSLGQMLHRTEKLPYHGTIDPRRFSDRDRD